MTQSRRNRSYRRGKKRRWSAFGKLAYARRFQNGTPPKGGAHS
jgi:hypothetical protein